MAARSKARVCGRSPAEIVGSNLAGGMDVCLLWVSSVVRYRSLRRADRLSRGVLPTVMCRCVWSRNLVNEESLAHWGLSRQKQANKHYFNYSALLNKLLHITFRLFKSNKKPIYLCFLLRKTFNFMTDHYTRKSSKEVSTFPLIFKF